MSRKAGVITVTQYDDEILKIRYLRNRIASLMTQREMYPDRADLEHRLQAIDTKLALFKKNTVWTKDKFDVETFNDGCMLIYHDLVILYQLIYKYSIERYQETKSYIDTSLEELNNMAARVQAKTRFETGITPMGDTLFYRGNGFSPVTVNTITSLNLGKISVKRGSKVAFFIEGQYFSLEDVVFKLGESTCSSYGYNRDYVKIPGEAEYKIYNCSMPEDVKRSKAFQLSSNDFIPKLKNRYDIYAGKDKIMVEGETLGKIFYDKDASYSVTIKERKGIVSFYVINGSYINFSFSTNLTDKNFSDNYVKNLDKHHKISFSFDLTHKTDVAFGFNFTTDGMIYATGHTGVVKDGGLFYPEEDNGIFDFRVEEYSGGESVELPLSIVIDRGQYATDYEPYITMVAVKELEEEMGLE